MAKVKTKAVMITVLVPEGGKITKVVGEDKSGTPVVLEIK